MTRALGLLLGALFAAALVAALVFYLWPSDADAPEGSSVVNGYPKHLTFKLIAHSESNVTDVSLAYSITGRGGSAIGKPANPPSGRNIGTEVVLQVNSAASYIPVGSEFVYHWEITSADGKTVSGPEQTFFFLPPNQDWKSVKGEFMTVYYHGDKESLASSYLKAGVETYDKIGKALFGVTLKQVPVKVILFDNEKESDSARPGAGTGTYDAAVTTCGTKVTNDIILLIPVECGSTDRTDTLRHEFGHILNQAAGEGLLAKLPSWLDEGTAVYAQLDPGDFQTAFAQAASAKRLIPFSEMVSPTSDPKKVGVFYGEAYNMVKYLVDKGGPAKYGEFFATMKKGQRFDQALQTVYGFGISGFEAEFLAAQDPSIPRPPVVPTSAPQQVQPTRLPTQRPQQVQPTGAPTKAPEAPAASSDGGEISTASKIIVGVAVLFVLLALLSFLALQMMANNRKRAAVAPPAPPDDPAPGRPDVF